MPKTITEQSKKKPVADPVRDAEERCGGAFIRKKTVSPWEPWISRCTTGQFAGLDGGYHRHCGPTAITNLILTLAGRYGYPDIPLPDEVFSNGARIGQKMKIYWNTDILGYFGGTYDILTELYIRNCLRHFRIPVDKKLPDHVSVRWHGLPSGIQFLRALDEGKLLYLQLYLHPCYGTHHVLCYGYTAVHSTDSGGKDKEKNRKQREIYLIIADGWNRRPRYLRLKSRGLCNFFAIE